MTRALPVFLGLLGAWLPLSAFAAEPVQLAKTADEPAFVVRVLPAPAKGAAARVTFASCAAEPCAAKDFRSLDLDERFDQAAATLQTVVAPNGSHVVWVRLPERGGPRAFEALLAPGQTEPLFAGVTSPAAEAGATTQKILRRDLPGGRTLLALSSIPPGGGLCGLPDAPGSIRAWDGVKWASAALPRLDAAATERAVPLAAVAAAPETPLRYLQPTGGSDESFGRAAVDADPRTAWLETRTGDGTGEYATYRLDPALAVKSISFVLAPSVPPPKYAAPRSFYLLFDSAIFEVKPAAGPDLAVTLPKPVHSACMSLVLGEADQKVPAPRTVGLAEVGARTALDAEPVDALVARLATPAQADEALATLLGRPSLGGAWKKVYAALSPERRAKVDAVVTERGCSEAAPIAVLALSDPDGTLREQATRKLESCRRESAPALVAALDDLDEARAREAGRLLALLAPSVAQVELPPRLGHEATRAAFWPALSKAFRSADAAALSAALAAATTPAARLDVVLALGDRLDEVPSARSVLTEALGSSALATRYRAVEPALRVQDPSIADDREPAVRQRVWLVLAERPRVPAFDALARSALADGNPRVRAAAADYFRAHPEGLEASALVAAAKDPWPFVRLASLRALGRAPLVQKQAALSQLRARLEDPSFDVRRGALEAMAGLPPKLVREDILARLDDEREAVPVRAQAARALGAVCSTEDLDRLTLLAQATLAPMAFELEREVGLGAIEALGVIHPRDLAQRLAPLRTKKTPPSLKAAADRALAGRGQCGH